MTNITNTAVQHAAQLAAQQNSINAYNQPYQGPTYQRAADVETKERLFQRCFDSLQHIERELANLHVSEGVWAKYEPLRRYFINDPSCPELLEGMVRRLEQVGPSKSIDFEHLRNAITKYVEVAT
jgi:hypothetical protein